MERSKLWAIALIVATMGPTVGAGGLAGAALAPVGLGHDLNLASNSLNWAGYAVTGGSGSVTQVTGSWVEPAVSCPHGGSTYSAFWDGIDGFNSNTVEQGGSLAYCSHGSAHYSVWYEFYPAASVTISSITVHPGDAISVTVSYSTSTSQFSITVQDGTHGYTQTGSVSGAARTSAECIAERPTVGGRLANLANFGKADFGADYTATIGCGATVSGTTGSFGSFSTVSAINMVDSAGRTLATTGTLSSDGTSFVETFVASS